MCIIITLLYYYYIVMALNVLTNKYLHIYKTVIDWQTKNLIIIKYVRVYIHLTSH